MTRRRLPLGLSSLALALLALSCTDTIDPVSPGDPLFAKGGKPGQSGGGTTSEPSLQEFWVYQDSGCPGDMVHVVVAGDFLRLGVGFAHDHFFNGVQDDDPPFDTHYEFHFSGPEDPATEFSPDGTLGHEDLCFEGERSVDRNDQGDVVHTSYFGDYPATALDAGGADPFSIGVGALISQTDRRIHSASFRPLGVVEGGEVLEREEASVHSTWHGADFTNVRSWAVHDGEDAPGSLSFQNLSISGVACTVTTTTVGKGRNKTREARATVSAQVSIAYGADGIYNQNFWGEGHVRVVAGGQALLSSRLSTPQTSSTFSVSEELSPGTDWSGQEIQVEFVADFLHALGADSSTWTGTYFSELYDWVYDPGENAPSIATTAGLGVDASAWDATSNVSSELDDGKFPVAHSNAVSVTCR